MEKHRAVIEKVGQVWFGKIGRSISRSSVEHLERQIDSGEPTFLFLVARDGRSYHISRANIGAVRLSPPDKTFEVPHYYFERGIAKRMRLWILLKSITESDMSELSQFCVGKSGREVAEMLASMASLCFLARK